MDVSDRNIARDRDNIGTGDRGIISRYFTDVESFKLGDRFRSKNHVNLLPTGMKEIKDYLQQLIGLAVCYKN